MKSGGREPESQRAHIARCKGRLGRLREGSDREGHRDRGPGHVMQVAEYRGSARDGGGMPRWVSGLYRT